MGLAFFGRRAKDLPTAQVRDASGGSTCLMAASPNHLLLGQYLKAASSQYSVTLFFCQFVGDGIVCEKISENFKVENYC